ncbi:hypothetical protein D3C79_785880 [compost metagenome]
MIDIAGWPESVRLMFVLSPFIIGLPGLALSIYTTVTKEYVVACAAITSNPYLEILKRSWGVGSFKWRWMVICTLSGLLAFPWLAIRTGKLDKSELDTFPINLKRRLVISAWLTVSGFSWLVVSWVILEF